MASEFPSDDVEAFVHSGTMVFDRYLVEKFRQACRPPRFTGEIQARADAGDDALDNLKFIPDAQGQLSIWALPDIDTSTICTDRYLTVVDIGGRSAGADFSVIAVFDRINMIDGLPLLSSHNGTVTPTSTDSHGKPHRSRHSTTTPSSSSNQTPSKHATANATSKAATNPFSSSTRSRESTPTSTPDDNPKMKSGKEHQENTVSTPTSPPNR